MSQIVEAQAFVCGCLRKGKHASWCELLSNVTAHVYGGGLLDVCFEGVWVFDYPFDRVILLVVVFRIRSVILAILLVLLPYVCTCFLVRPYEGVSALVEWHRQWRIQRRGEGLLGPIRLLLPGPSTSPALCTALARILRFHLKRV